MTEHLKRPNRLMPEFVTIASADWMTDQERIHISQAQYPEIANILEDEHYIRYIRLSLEAIRAHKRGYSDRMIELGMMKVLAGSLIDLVEEMYQTGSTPKMDFLTKQSFKIIQSCKDEPKAYVSWRN